MKILVVNCGSSSLKYQLIDMETKDVIAKGNFERIGDSMGIHTHSFGGDKVKKEFAIPDHGFAFQKLLEALKEGAISDLSEISAVGHRTVHGGTLTESVLIDDSVIEKLKEFIPFAPLHNPPAIKGIEACRELMPNTPMVAVFDTSFHQTLPEERYIYPVDYKYYEQYGLRKYGFHGTSFRYVAERTAEYLNKDVKDMKMVICHLGQGASICAVKDGKSVEVSTGFSTAAGIMMCARSGDLDPRVVTFIQEKEGLTTEEVDQLLLKKSGILGISGVSSDMRDIEAEYEKGNKRAILALEMYAYSVAQYVAKFCVALGGLDTLVFTAGIGEHKTLVRRKVADYLSFLGCKIDLEKDANVDGECIISAPDSKVTICVIPTNEELMIAKDTAKIAFNK